MTELQKKIFECLCRGGHIVRQLPGEGKKQQMPLFDLPELPTKKQVKYSVREKDFKLVHRILEKNTPAIFEYCREVKQGKVKKWIINRKKVLSLHGGSWLKKTYKRIRRDRKICKPSTVELIKFNKNKN